MKIKGSRLLVLAMVAALGACTSTPDSPESAATKESEAATSAAEKETDNGTAKTYPTDSGEVRGVTSETEAAQQAAAAKQEQEALRKVTVFYFGFDQARINSEDVEALQAHAEVLSGNPNLSVRLEGHADERGTREYNIALGENRGVAVSKLLRANGVSASQIEVISYGEERPAQAASDDTSWSKNRRVEIKY